MCSTAENVQRWLKQKIMFDAANISCKTLAKELGCGIRVARSHLEKFYSSEDAGRLKVKATYVVCGKNTKSMADCSASLRIELAEEGELEDVKAKLDLVSCVELHSVKASQPPDANLLQSEREAIILKPTPTSLPKHETTVTQSGSGETSRAEQRPTQFKNFQVGKSPRASDIVLPSKKPAAQKSDEDKAQSAKGEDPTSLASYKKPATGPKVVETQARTGKDSTDKRALTKAAVKVSRSEPDKRKLSKSVSAESEASNPSPDKQTGEQPPGDDDDVTKATGQCVSPSKSKKKRSVQEDEGPTLSTRKRVTKTRIIQKKKIVRVKDLKGYRVNKEEIEEVEETYTDYESEPENQPKAGQRNKKPRKELGKPGKTVSESSASIKSPDEKRKRSDLSRTESNLKDGAVSHTTKSKGDGGKKSASEDQTNITSFFKKG